MTKLLLSLSIFLIYGGVSTTLTASYGPNDVVANSGDNVTFAHTSDSLTPTDFFSWGVYNPQPKTIYQKGDTQPSNPDKYTVFYNGSFCLNVSKVTTQDALTYCLFSSKTKNVSCANLIVIDSMVALVNPSSGMSLGQSANLTCVLRYGGPTTDESNIRPLSPDQDPEISMYIGNIEIENLPPGVEVIGSDNDLHSKSISINRNVTKNDIGLELKCSVETSKPSYKRKCSSPINIRCPTTNAVINHANNSTGNNTRTHCCNVNDVLNCTANGFPYPTVTWTDETGQVVQPLDVGNSYSAVQLKKSGEYFLNCSARNDLSTAAAIESIYIDTNGAEYGRSISGTLGIHDVTSSPMALLLWSVILAMASSKVLAD